MLDKEQQHISFFRSQPVTSVCKHAWRRAEQTLTSHECRRCRQVAFRFATHATLWYRWWFSRHQSHAVRNLLRSTEVMEMNRSISIFTEFCSLASGSADARNWLRQASSTDDDESGWASSSTRCSPFPASAAVPGVSRRSRRQPPFAASIKGMMVVRRGEGN